MDHANEDEMQAGRSKGIERLSKSDRFYVPILYVTFAVLIVANARNAANGLWMAYWSIAFLAAVVLAVVSRMPWAHIIVQIWAFICILGNGALLFSILYRGSTAASIGVVATLVAVMLFSAYFLIRAKAVLVPRSGSRETQVR
jgi:hypothetical protein